MTQQLELYDVTIIGGGPAGMYTAFYSGMRDLKTKIIEFNPQLGGKILLYPEKMIWDVGGVPPMSGEKLIDRLADQALVFSPTVVYNQSVAGLEKQEDGTFILTSTSGERHHTRTIILAMGHGIPVARKLEIEGADRYEVANLHYTVQELQVFAGKRVLISGGGDSAVDWANELIPIAKRVTVVHRRDQFGGLERNVARMKAYCDVLTPHELTSLHGNNSGNEIEYVIVQNIETETAERLEVDAIIVNHGMKGDLGLLLDWGLDMKDGLVVVDDQRATSIPGIFAAGDLITHPSKVKLIAGTFVDGVKALNSAKLYMDPQAVKVAYVSSHNERFLELNKQEA